MKIFKNYFKFAIGAHLLSFIVVFLTVTTLAFGQSQQSRDYVPGKIRIKLKKEAAGIVRQRDPVTPKELKTIGVDEIDAANDQNGITHVRRVFPFSPKFEAKHRQYGLDQWYELSFDPAIDPTIILKNYEKLSQIEIAKPVIKKTNLDKNSPAVVFDKSEAYKSNLEEEDSLILNDPLLKDQWHYYNDGRFGPDGFDIDLFMAWQKTTGSSDVIVSIVDQGVDVNHEDLAANMWQNEAEINGEAGIDDDGNGYIDDFHGWNFFDRGAVYAGFHGTHVAGTVGAVNNNGIGVAGVAGGDGTGNGVKLMSCQVFDASMSGGQNFAEAIVYSADNGAVISQNSWGYNQADYYEPEIVDAINYFINEAGQFEGSPMNGGILFFAAGNTGTALNKYPGAFENVIGVTAIGPNGLPTSYSTHGEWTDIAAPGGDMVEFGEEGGVLSTFPGDSYGYLEGTSMACPHVSGVAALVIAKFGGPSFDAAALRRIILSSTASFDFVHDNLYGQGYLNAQRALIDDNRIPPLAINDLRATDIYHDEIRLAWTVPADPDGNDPAYFYFTFSDAVINADNFNNGPIYILENKLEFGETYDLRLTGLLKNKDYWVAVKSADQFENISDISNILHVVTSSEPHFMASSRSINLTLDAQNNLIENVPLTFSNIGEGIVYWNSSIRNEELFFGVAAENFDATISFTAEASATVEEDPSAITGISLQAVSEELLTTNGFEARAEHWENDVTEYITGLSYENGTYPVDLLGSTNANAGLIMATRFDIARDYTFNLTHLEVVLVPQVNDFPIRIEIKKGGRNNFFESETVYEQEYYPDTVNQLKYYRIPLYRPQRFEDGETFWVVLNFPKEMAYPLALQAANELIWDRFLISADNGRSYEELIDFTLSPRIPMISVYSTGNDGSYVFLDPTNGELPQGTDNSVAVTIDGSSLTNGQHLASLGIITNDIHKPIVNIEVKVNVINQLPEIENLDRQEFRAFANRDNSFALALKNIGLGDLQITGLSSSDAGLTADFSSTRQILPDDEGEIPIIYHPATTGIINTSALLQTNIGEILIPLQIIAEDEPVVALALTSNSLVVPSASQGEVELKIKNTGNGSSLAFDINDYSLAKTTAGLLPSKLNYRVTTSTDIDGPAANQWDDISGFAIQLKDSEAQGEFSLGMKFPYFNQMLEYIGISSFAQVIPFNDGFIMPLRIAGKGIVIKELFYYSFGDRTVITFKSNVTSFSGTGNNVAGQLEYQVVLFRDGTIEFRYKDVDYLSNGEDYAIWLDGLEYPEKIIYRDFGDEAITIENGTVIRFAPDKEVSMIKEASSLTGNISPGDSAMVKFVLAPQYFQKFAGQYQNEIIIRSNTLKQADTVFFEVNVTGEGMVEAQDILAFDTITVGQTDKGFIKVANPGSDLINLIGATSSSPDIQPVFIGPISIKANANYQLPIYFTPSSPNLYNELITLSFEDGTVVDVTVSAMGQPDVSYAHTIPDNLVFNLTAGETATSEFTITNTTAGLGLDYLFRNSVFTSVDSESPSGTTEGPGSFDYSWYVSDSLKIFHKWQDISEHGELINIEQGKHELIVLPFEFPFYGENFDSIWVSRNGYITVLDNQVDPEYALDFIPGDGISGIIAPFWSGLKPGATQGVMIDIEDDRIYLQWSDFVGSNSMTSPGKTTFQLELVRDGSIFFHYKDVSGWGGMLKHGLESPDEKQVLEDPKALIVDYADFTDGTTIAIKPPTQGSLSSGESRLFTIKATAENVFYPGTYQDTVLLATNSMAQAFLNIPVQLIVTGVPIINTIDTLSWDETVFHDAVVLKQTIKITNSGYDILSLDNIAGQNISGFEIYNTDGDKFVRNGAGDLLNPISIEPWSTEIVEINIPVSEKANVNGILSFSGNFNTKEVKVLAKIVDSPVFNWDATDQNLNVLNTENTTFSFTVENTGVSNLKYHLVPAVIPENSGSDRPGLIEEVGNYTFDKPATVDSLAIDWNQNADGVFTPFTVGANLSFANRFTAPEGGLYLTHIKTFNYLVAIGEYVRIKIYLGGDLPEEGELVYDQNFVIDKAVDQEWIYFELKEPFVIPEGQVFYVAVAPPVAGKYMGFDVSNDVAVLQNCFSGVYQGNDKFFWYPGYTQSETMVWKIRPLTAAGKAQWLELDHLTGELTPGGSKTVQATVIVDNLESGVYDAKVLASSNDINRPSDEFQVQITVNAAPVFDYYPNLYEDTLKVSEDDQVVFNYLFSDPEGETLSIQLDSAATGPQVEFMQLNNSTAQLNLTTGYEDEGIYQYVISLVDGAGNLVKDELLVEIIDKNRPPVLNQEYASFHFNLADTLQSLIIDPNDLFSDPDGDQLQIFAGNYSPGIVDLTFGERFLSLIPVAKGTAQVVFAADDGKQDGFVAYPVYVVVIDDPSAIGNGSSSNEIGFQESGAGVQYMSVYPNPVENNTTNLSLQLAEESTVQIKFFNTKGQLSYTEEFFFNEPGIHDKEVKLKGVLPGLYLCSVTANNVLLESVKIIVK